MISSFFGLKLDTAQIFNDQGNRLLVTNIKTEPLTITQIKNHHKDGYWAIQTAIGSKSKKSLTKPIKKHLKGAKLKQAPLHLREIRLNKKPDFKINDQLTIDKIFKINDQVKVTGLSKGRGFAGVIKRWGFHGGPRTHGQSDRERAPGSIGQRSDPGRVWKGKKMPGHYGHATKTVSGLKVINIDKDKNILQVSGTVPGSRKTLLKITVTKKAKKK